MPHSAAPYVVIAVLVAIMVLRVVRGMRGRPIKMNGLWIMPILMLIYAGIDLYVSPPRGPIDIAALALATLIGAAVGWQRGRLVRIDFDPRTGVLMSRTSPAAMILIIALLGARFALRAWITESGQGANLGVATNALLFFGFAVVGVARIEMWIRCRRLMAAGPGQVADVF